MIARFGAGGSPSRSCANASNPPADAPTPTMVKSGAGSGAAGRGTPVLGMLQPFARALRVRGRAVARIEQQLPQCVGSPLELGDLVIEIGGEAFQALRLRTRVHSFPQRDALLDGAQRAPERLLELFLHPVAKAVGVESMAHVTAVPHQAGFLDFPQRPATVGTRERRWRSVELTGAQSVGARLFGVRLLGFDRSAGPWLTHVSLARIHKQPHDDARHLFNR